MGCGSSSDPGVSGDPAATAPKPCVQTQPAKKNLMVKVPPGTPPGATIEIKAPTGATLRCQVPAGIPPGGTFQIQYDTGQDSSQASRQSSGQDPSNVPSNVPKVIDETRKVTIKVETSKLPLYWTNRKYNESNDKQSAFDDMVYINRDQHEHFDELFKETYHAKSTRDRPCPKQTDKCPKTAGGCPCVQPDGDPGMPKGYVVRSVIRVEDSGMWSRYIKNKERMRQKHFPNSSSPPLPSCDPAIKTDEICHRYEETFDPLDNGLNEVYLWHGTNVRAALSIAANDFQVNLAGSNTGTMYGRGTYLAECCTKADEYAADEPGGYYNGVFALLLCRVILGNFYYTDKRDEEAGNKVQAGHFDSTVGDRVKSVGTFREFVVYNAGQVYPEYVILYSRIHHADPQRKIDILSNSHFLMQLPIYWHNCYKNPLNDNFHEQYIIRMQTLVLLQKLLEACFEGENVTIVKARRVENSTIWNGYINSKNKLLEQVGGADSTKSFKPPNKLDGKHATGHLLTHMHLKDEDTEQSISIRNLEERVNECMLWHGTSRAAAEKIAVSDFYIPKGKEMKRAARFGNGAYLSEDVGCALCGCDDTETTMVLLLCRVLCGDIYYTEKHTEIDAGQSRDRLNKHSVLGNPEGRGPREFVVPNTEQVYPEFVVEVVAPGWVAPVREEARKVKVQLIVPAGFSGGMTMAVQTPDGREVQVMLPPGVLPGQVVQMDV